MKYKCLITDHDDTLLNSTEEVHYPAMLECLRVLRPEMSLTFDEFAFYNFDYGFLKYATEILGMDDKEMQIEMEMWRKWTDVHRPTFFDGVREVLSDFKNSGGIFVVSSHSEKSVILKDLENAGCPAPDAVFGWELPPEKRKPSLYTIEKTQEMFGIKPEEMIMLDDMPHGLEMCRKAGVKFIFADWARKPDKLRERMKKASDYTAENFYEVKDIIM